MAAGGQKDDLGASLDLFDCQVCLEPMVERQPRTLSACNHTFCQQCLVKLVERQMEHVICPTCRKVTDVRNGIKEAILKKCRAWERLYEEGKYEELWDTVYLPEGLCFPPGDEPYPREKYVALLGQIKENPGIARMILFNSNIVMLGDTAAVETSRYKAFHKDGTQLELGNSMVLWEKRNGDWFMKFDMWNH